MSDETNGDTHSQVTTLMPMERKVYLYVLRSTTAEEKFKIKAYFSSDIKYTFNRDEAYDDKAVISPYVYRTELDLNIDNQDRLSVRLSNGSFPIQTYRLRLSRKILQTDKTFRDYNDDKDRYLDNPRSIVHHFLFDVNFARNLVDGPPGKCLFINRKYHRTFVY